MFLQKARFFFSISFFFPRQTKSTWFFFYKNFRISNDLNLSPPKTGKGNLVEINKIFFINNFYTLVLIVRIYLGTVNYFFKSIFSSRQ